MRAIVVAGSCPQVVLLQQLKERGFYTILLDNNPDAVARPYADRFVKVNIFDSEAVKKVAREENADLLFAVCADQVLLTVAKVSEDLDLPCYITYDTACKVSDKGHMKDIFREYGIPSSKHVFMSELTEDSITDMAFPLVVKPVDAYSSKGVRKATNYNELVRFFREASEISRSGVVIVEEFVEGEELTIDFQVVDGKAKLLCVSNTEKVAYEDRFLAFRTRYPAEVRPEKINRIKIIGQKLADAFNLKNTPMLIQLLTDDQRESVLEFSARTGGGAKYLLLKRATGFDPIHAVVDLTLGEKVDVGEFRFSGEHIINVFLYGNPGVFDHLERFEELKEKGILFEYWQFKWRGAEIRGAYTSSDRIASITIVADTFEDLKEKQRIAKERLRIIDIEGRDILRHDLITELIPL